MGLGGFFIYKNLPRFKIERPKAEEKIEKIVSL